MIRPAVTLLVVAICAGSATAHVVPQDNHDRIAVVRLGPSGLQIAVRYELDLFTATVDLHRAKHPASGRLTRDEVPAVYADYLAGELPKLLQIDLDDKPLAFHIEQRSHRLTDHLRCEYLLKADWPALVGEHQLVVRDAGWEEDEASRIALYLDTGPGVELLSARVPDAALIARRADDWQPGDRERRRTLRVHFTARATDPPGRYRPALPPEPEPEKPTASGALAHGDIPATSPGENRAEPGWAAARSADSAPILLETTGAETPARSRWSLRELLLDSRLGLGTLLLLSALFGAAHALTPGHGKTMVAAYLVGERGTIGHAVLLGVVTTLTHTAAVLILAAILPWLVGREQHVETALEFLGGLLIALMGLFLLLRRLLGQSDHVHLFSGHSHEPAAEGTTVRWLDLILLGVAGGIVPCWDAIAMLAAAIVLGQLWLALPLLLAFSAGLAFVLVAIGIGVVLARKAARPHLEKHRDRLETIGRVLPLLTSVVILVLGFWLCWDALHAGHHP